MTLKPVHVIGGGLAGSEAAWQLAQAGVPVVLHEMRPLRATAAHKTDGYAELVCSNSFRSDDKDHNAVGLLHAEMRRLGSLVMRAADANQVPAGGALAVDRDGFSAAVSRRRLLRSRSLRSSAAKSRLPPEEWDSVIIATGPLTSPDLAATHPRTRPAKTRSPFSTPSRRSCIATRSIWNRPGSSRATTKPGPAARAPTTSIARSRANNTTPSSTRCSPARKPAFHEWEASTPYFDGCLPIEVMAERGRETLRHGPMKPFGLTNPREPDVKPYAVVQLRQDNKLGTLFNMVGFQTKLKHGEQVRIFRTIPGLAERRIRPARRPAPQYLPQFAQAARCDAAPEGQSGAGVSPARSPAARAMSNPPPSACSPRAFAPPSGAGEAPSAPPPTTAHGALLAHITGGHIETIDAGPSSFQPMNVNFGLFPPIAAPATAEGRKFGRGSAKNLARKNALSATRARRSRALDCRRAAGRRRGIISSCHSGPRRRREPGIQRRPRWIPGPALRAVPE